MVVCNYEFDRGQHRLRVNCLNCLYGSSIEDFPICMARTIDKLIEVKGVNTIVLASTREFEYGPEQTRLLNQIAEVVFSLLKRQRMLSPLNLNEEAEKCIPGKNEFLSRLLTIDIRQDPIGAYVKILREMRHQKQWLKNANANDVCLKHRDYYLNNILAVIKDTMESADLIKMVKDRLVGYSVGDRTIYREFFRPTIRPNFMLTRFMTDPPKDGKKIDRYFVGDIEVQIFKLADQVQKIYHVVPPEFKLGEEEYTVLDIARRYMSAHKPTKTEFAEPERMREIFTNIGRDMITEISENMNLNFDHKKIMMLSGILTRYTAGYGILEVILLDPAIQDIYLNAPMGGSPIFVYHDVHEECITNLIPTREDADAWATRFRIESGRPLDEANPVLDTEIDIPGVRARVAAITRSLSPDGYSVVLRRHRVKPWTLPLFIKNRMLNPLAAGLISFLVDGARPVLIAGTRSAGKTAFLGAVLTELMQKYRIITVEDTLELPVHALNKLGYDIQSMKSRSIITHIEAELPADEAIRTSLRMGDSCLIVGEVRSVEAKALYESMRIGALANLVAGTIHGDSPYGVFDRVVNDLGVPPTSFKATDIIMIASRLKSADGLTTFRRLTEIVELTKLWDENPQKEKGFVPLMVYNSKTDELEPTETFLNGESFVLNEIAERVADWRDNWNSVWDNIQLRARIKKRIVEYSQLMNDPSLLEAEYVIPANNKFHLISEQVKRDYGTLESERIFTLWDEWFKGIIKRKKRGEELTKEEEE